MPLLSRLLGLLRVVGGGQRGAHRAVQAGLKVPLGRLSAAITSNEIWILCYNADKVPAFTFSTETK